jgi:transposase
MSGGATQRRAGLARENRRLRTANAALRRQLGVERAKNRRLEQRVRDLQRERWGKKSERTPVPPLAPAKPPTTWPEKTSDQPRPGQKRGPKPLDPRLPREIVQLPDPPAEKLLCPVTGERLRSGFIETVEVLVAVPAKFLVRRYERTVFVSAAKSAPVCTPWPDGVFPRARVDASVFAQVAAEHYCEHQPFNRIAQRLARAGVRLSRATLVSQMQQLDQQVQPIVAAIKAELMAQPYLHLDATPVPLCDPARPGGTVEATVWGFRAHDEPLCWYQFCAPPGGKSPRHPDRELQAAGFAGLLQVDGASGLSAIGLEDKVTPLGCLSHARRYAHKAVADGDQDAEVYLQGFNRLFRLDRLGKRFRLRPENFATLRLTYSLPLFDLLVAMAEGEIAGVPPKTHLGECLHYLIEQQEYLRNCLTITGAELTNNAAERALRPVKTGVKNWQWIGHPQAGSRFANLFTLTENCRLAGVDVPAYLTDLIERLPGHPNHRIAELLPAAWQSARATERKAAADPPAA